MATTEQTIAATLRMRVELDRYVSAADRELAKMWSAGWDEVADEFASATAELARMAEQGDWPSRTEVLRAQRAQNALKVCVEAVQDLATRSGIVMVEDLTRILDSAERWSETISRTQLPDTGVRIAWDRVDAKALEAIVKRTTRQVTALTRPLPADVIARMKSVLIRGVAVGENPNVAARQILDRCHGVFDGGLARARNIARTEMLDAHRAAATQARQANKDTLAGWRWHCELSNRTCPSCLSQNGSTHPVDEQGPNDHQQGRCTAVPVTKTWRDLGIDLDEPESTFPDARAWFDEQPTAVQLQIMGPARLKALNDGALSWDDLSRRVQTPGWRDSYRVPPLA